MHPFAPTGYRYVPAKIRTAVLIRDGWLCQYCGADTRDAHGPFVDHIVPVARGGHDLPYNLAVACFACNEDKAAKIVLIPRDVDRITADYPQWREHILYFAQRPDLCYHPPGRTPLAADDRKQPWGLCLSQRERQAIEQAAHRANAPTYTWARQVLLEAAGFYATAPVLATARQVLGEEAP